jgi:CBS domain-containing protein
MPGLTVRDGMNAIVVTVGPDHSLREAARRMADRQVGAAVVMDTEGSGPGMITERDLLRSNGRGEDIDEERVRDHLASELIYAYPDWPLETAAEKMTAGGFRHVIVLDESGAPIAILSMRDIVRCWTTAGLGRAPAEPTTA